MKFLPTTRDRLLGLSTIAGVTLFSLSATATTLTGFSTTGADMKGMNITVNFFNGTSQTAVWQALDRPGGGAFGSGWSLTQYGNTFGTYKNPWQFSYTGGSSVSALIIDAFAGNTVFDNIYPQVVTPGSADGWPFELSYGARPDRHAYDVPIDISRGDLFGRLSLFWDEGFWGNMGFFADTDSGTGNDPVRPRYPVPAPPPPPQVAPSLLSLYIPNSTIYEGQSTTAYLYGSDNNADYLNFYLNGGYIGTDYRTAGTRYASRNLGTFYDEGVHSYTGYVQDSAGNWSNPATQTVTVLNVAPTINQITPNLTLNEGDWFDFLANATDPGIYDVLTYDWDLDSDGLYDDYQGRTGRYSYADEGAYRLGVQVNDGDGGFDWSGFNVNVLNVAPTITQLTDHLVVKRNEFFDFSGTATDPGVQDLLSFDWDFNGDGLFDDFTGNSGKWSFADPGLFDVTLRVSDGDGGLAYRQFTVQAVPEPTGILSIVAVGVLGASVLRKSSSSGKSEKWHDS
jgi:hypothetical protein